MNIFSAAHLFLLNVEFKEQNPFLINKANRLKYRKIFYMYSLSEFFKWTIHIVFYSKKYFEEEQVCSDSEYYLFFYGSYELLSLLLIP